MRIVKGKPVEASQLERATTAWLRIGKREPKSIAQRYKEWRSTMKPHLPPKQFVCRMAVRYAEARALKLGFKSELYGN